MKRIIGIDLGTTNTVAAFYDGDTPSIIPNERGRHLTPSVVALSESGELLVGEAAKNQSMVNPRGTVHSVKRLMGQDVQISLLDKKFSPQEIAALILKKVRRDSEEYLGEEIQNAVISVPAYFNEPQRRATREAGHLAGLKVIKILNEPTAASLAYASQIKEKKNILVYDIGGGTFDATVLSSDGSNFRVLATSGNKQLGGVDFDELLLQRVLEQFSAQTNIELRKEPFLLQQLLEQVEKAKIELSSRQEAIIALPFIGTDGAPIHLQYKVSRQDLNDLIKPSIEQTIELRHP